MTYLIYQEENKNPYMVSEGNWRCVESSGWHVARSDGRLSPISGSYETESAARKMVSAPVYHLVEPKPIEVRYMN